MQKTVLLLLVFVCVPASAQVYKRTGPDGKVYFSDTPGSDATQVEVAPAQTISMPPVVQQAPTTEQQDDAASAYTEFTIVNPTSEQDIRANDGNITVRLSLRPELRPGHTIRVIIDGEDGHTITAGDGMTVELRNLSRGRHSVEASVINDAGEGLTQTGPVNFNILRVAAGGG